MTFTLINYSVITFDKEVKQYFIHLNIKMYSYLVTVDG